MDEKLRFVIELQNKASAEIKKLARDIGGIKPSAGMVQTHNWFNKLSSASDTASKSVRPLVGGLNMVGAGGLAAGLSIAGLAKQFVDLAKALPALQELSRQTGMSRTEIERLKATAANLGVDPTKMQASLSSYSRMMVEFHKRSGTLYEEMANHGASGLAEKIRREDPGAAYRDILKWLDAIPEAQRRAGRSAADAAQIQRHWAGEAFGDEDMAQLVSKGMGGFEDAAKQAAQDVHEITDEMVKQAAAFDRSIARFDASWDALKRDLATTVLPALTATTEGMRKLFDEVKNEPEIAAVGAASLGALYARRKIMNAVSGGGRGGGIAPGTAAQIEGAAVKQSTATTTFAEAVAEFRAGVREMNARGNGPGGGPVKEPEKDGENFAAKLKRLAPAIATGTVLGAVGVGITAAILDRDQSKSLVDGGRPDVLPSDNNLGLPGVDTPQESRAPTASAYHPDDDRAGRARASDAPDRSLDNFVVGSLEKPVLRLVGTLKTASAQLGDGAFRPAAFHPAALGASLAAGTPEAMIAAAVKAGTLAAFREWAGMQDIDAKAGGPGGMGGFTQAAFHPGGGMGRGGGGSGGYYDTSGGGTTRAGGTLAANQREAYAAAIGEGLSKTAARALVADLSGEGLAHDAHRVHQDGSHPSGGIAQWDPTRAADIQRQFGKLPWEMDVGGQTRAAIWEYRNRKRFAATKTAMEGSDPAEMIHQLVANYEDPRDKGTAIRQRMGYYRGFDPDAPGGGDVEDSLGKLHLARKVTGVQCVALANAAVGFAGSVKDWRKGIGVAAGTMKDGTPVATFLNRDGSQSDRYAGGGIGTEGAHLDHAAIFRRYLKDAAGKIIGMTVSEQSRGRPLHLKDYKFGQGWGEGDGANYHAIMGPDGKPLGGRANPLNPTPLPEIRPAPPAKEAPQARRDDDESHLHVHLHQDGRVRSVRTASSGIRLHLDTGRTFTQFG